jgi:hypothetical protein
MSRWSRPSLDGEACVICDLADSKEDPHSRQPENGYRKPAFALSVAFRQASDQISRASLAADRNLARDVFSTRADLAIRRHDFGAAMCDWAQAESILDTHVDRARFFTIERALASLLSGDGPMARARLEPLAEKDEFGAEHQARVLRFLAEVERSEGKIAAAIELMRHGVAALEADPKAPHTSPIDFGVNETSHQLALSLDQAVSFALAAPSDVALARYAVEAALRIKGRQLATSAAELMKLGLTALGGDAKMRRLRSIRVRLGQALHDLAQEPSATPDWPILDALLSEEAELQREFAVQSTAPASPAVSDATKLAEAMQAHDTGVIIYVTYRNYDRIEDTLGFPPTAAPQIAAAWLMPGQPARWFAVGPAADVAHAVEILRAAIVPDFTATDCATKGPSLQNAAAAQSAGADLARLIFGERIGELASLTHLVISAEGSLNLVPFAALSDSVHGRFLGEKLAVRLIASLDDLSAPTGASASVSSAVIFADPDFNAMGANAAKAGDLAPASPRGAVPWCDLPGTHQELRNLQRALPKATVFEGADATKQALIGIATPGILHIATHGDFRPLLATIGLPDASLDFHGSESP